MKTFKAAKIIKEHFLCPPRCIFCGSEDCTRATPLCPDCFKKYARAALEGCEDCGAQPCDCRCFSVKNCAALYWLFNYKEKEIRSLVLRMKRGTDVYALKFLAARLADSVLAVSNGAAPYDCVCFVPRSPRTKALYGHDHAEELALRVADALGLRCFALLKHTGVKGEQKQLSREFRGDAAKTRFEINEALLTNGRLPFKAPLLCDDVVTTGSTAGECAHILKRYGARYVGLCFIAHTPRAHR